VVDAVAVGDLRVAQIKQATATANVLEAQRVKADAGGRAANVANPAVPKASVAVDVEGERTSFWEFIPNLLN
jgi:hypothetical protein